MGVCDLGNEWRGMRDNIFFKHNDDDDDDTRRKSHRYRVETKVDHITNIEPLYNDFSTIPIRE